MYEVGDRIEQYELEQCLNRDATGRVWKARDRDQGKTVEIKIGRNPAFLSYLRQKKEGAPGREYPGRVTIQAYRPDAEPPFMVREYIPGPDLSRILKERGRLEWEMSSTIICRVLDVLSPVHDRGELHRNLRPENVKIHLPEKPWFPLPEDPEVFVSDFGPGAETDRHRSELLVSGEARSRPDLMANGSFRYMAPEQKRKKKLEPATDIFAVGTILYELLTGEIPEGAFPYPSKKEASIPPEMDAIIWKSLRPDRKDRYRHAGEMKADLDLLREGGSPSAEREYHQKDLPGSSRNDIRHAELPLHVSERKSVYNLSELVDFAGNNPKALIPLLLTGHLSKWLRKSGEKRLSRLVRKLREEEENPSIAVQKFLEATGLVEAPDMELRPGSITPGPLYTGEEYSFDVDIRANGRGLLYGTCRKDRDVEWIRLETNHFSGRQNGIQGRIVTRHLEPDQDRTRYLIVETNGGTAKIPVSPQLQKRPPSPRFSPARQEIILEETGEVTESVQLENQGEKPLTGKLRAPADWIKLEEDRVSLEPGENRTVSFRVVRKKLENHPSFQRKGGGQHSATGAIELKTPDRTRTHRIEGITPRSPSRLGIPVGVITGLIPVASQVLYLLVFYNLMINWSEQEGSTEDELHRKTIVCENTYWILGLTLGMVLQFFFWFQ